MRIFIHGWCSIVILVFRGVDLDVDFTTFIGKMLGTPLEWYPSCLNPQGSL